MNQHVPPPNIISPQAVDVPRAQVDAIHCIASVSDDALYRAMDRTIARPYHAAEPRLCDCAVATAHRQRS